MAKSKKLYPGMGQWVVILKDPHTDNWYPTEGAKTEEAARKKMRLYSHYIFGETIKIVENV